MQGLENQELMTYLNGVIAATRAGALDWRIANPTTYLLEVTIPRPARLILQRLERMEQTQEPGKPPITKKVISYVLNGFDLSGGQQIQRLSLNGMVEADLNQPLEELFEVVETAKSRQALDFLKSIIPKPAAE